MALGSVRGDSHEPTLAGLPRCVLLASRRLSRRLPRRDRRREARRTQRGRPANVGSWESPRTEPSAIQVLEFYLLPAPSARKGEITWRWSAPGTADTTPA